MISVILVNHNGKKWLKNCLDSVLNQTHPSYEVIVVDNASTDGGRELIKKKYPTVKLVESDMNLGFAGGNNLGVKWAKGEYILLLNTDTTVEKNTLVELEREIVKLPKTAALQPRLLQMSSPEKLDQCGAYWTNSTILYYYGWGKNASMNTYSKPLKFFSVTGAAMFIRKEVIDKIGLFDEDFWCYYEETDFCHRAWIAGFDVMYTPHGAVYHAKGGTSTAVNNAYVQYHNHKNKLCSYLKNFQIQYLLVYIPMFLCITLANSALFLAQLRPDAAAGLLKAIAWNVRHIRSTLHKRKLVQNMRKKSDSFYFKTVKINPRVDYYIKFFYSLEYYQD